MTNFSCDCNFHSLHAAKNGPFRFWVDFSDVFLRFIDYFFWAGALRWFVSSAFFPFFQLGTPKNTEQEMGAKLLHCPYPEGLIHFPGKQTGPELTSYEVSFPEPNVSHGRPHF